jgi:methionine aminotransferase
VLVLSDEAYEHLVYDGQSHESVARYPNLASRSLLCASFGKTFHTTGWKMGYCAAPAELMKEFRKIHEFNVFAVNHPVQKALAKYLRQPENYLELPAFFQEKRDFFLDAVRGSRFNFTPAQGTYFQLLEYRNITDERDVDFAKRITKEYGLASIPISVFNEHLEDNRQLRFCFAKKKETLEKAGEILQRI